MIKKVIFSCLLLQCLWTYGQKNTTKNEFSLLFIGDIMGHDAQIEAAYDSISKTYNYEPVFEKIKPVIQKYDVAIANLEVTLAGKPFKGYPQFSSPDALAVAAKKAGIDVFVTANNHSCDRGKNGILRTIQVLDSLKIRHTGTFKNKSSRSEDNLLVLKKNGIKIGLLNYTYGTNGIDTPAPTFVNRIDTALLAQDVLDEEMESLDKLIVVLHWGTEYQRKPNKQQEDLAEFLFKKGVDIIIGSHPHVVQRLEYHPQTENSKERFIAYSLGNFVSNQRAKTKDGGIMASLSFCKDKDGNVAISDKGYILTWVNRTKEDKKYNFEILPCAKVEERNFKGLNSLSKNKIQYYIKDTRHLLESENKNVFELK